MSEKVLGKLVEINQKAINLFSGKRHLSAKEFREIDNGKFVSVDNYLKKQAGEKK